MPHILEQKSFVVKLRMAGPAQADTIAIWIMLSIGKKGSNPKENGFIKHEKKYRIIKYPYRNIPKI